MKARLFNTLIVLLIVSGLVGGFILLSARRALDNEQSRVAFVMNYSDAVNLVAGGAAKFNPAAFVNAGITAMLVAPGEDGYDQDLIRRIRQAGMAAGLRPGSATDCAVFAFEYANTGSNFPLYLAGSLPAGHELLSGGGICLSLLEDASGHVDTRGYAGYAGEYVRAMTLSGALTRDNAGNYDLSTVEEGVYEAVVERGVRVVIIAPFAGGSTDIVGDLSVYKTFIADLTARFALQGLAVDPAIRGARSDASGGATARLFLSLGLAAVLLLFVDRIKRFGLLVRSILLGVFLIASVILWTLLPPVSREISAFIAYTALPCLALSFLLRHARALALSNGSRSVSSVLFYALGTVTVTAVISMAGAMLGFLSLSSGSQPYGFISYGYATETYIILFVWLIIQMFRSIYLQHGTPFGEYFASVCYSLGHKKSRTVAIALLVVVIFLLWLHVFRGAEHTLWDLWTSLLRRKLPVVPGAAEYFVGYPAAALALVLYGRRMRSGAWPFLLLALALPASMIAGSVSAGSTIAGGIWRFLLGFGFGMAMALVIAGAVSLGIRLTRLSVPKDWQI